MSRLRRQEIQEDVSPNLIPMIDIMFLLLLFFMLGADMGHRELEDVRLPQAKSIKEDKEGKGEHKDRLTINIYHRYAGAEFRCPVYESQKTCREEGHWKIGIRGTDYTGTGSGAARDLSKLEGILKSEADRFRTDPDNPSLSERRVMVRADALAPYGYVQDVMRQCVRVGIYKIECGAAREAEKKAGARG
jgi:biopolymer transport protein ExbD